MNFLGRKRNVLSKIGAPTLGRAWYADEYRLDVFLCWVFHDPATNRGQAVDDLGITHYSWTGISLDDALDSFYPNRSQAIDVLISKLKKRIQPEQERILELQRELADS